MLEYQYNITIVIPTFNRAQYLPDTLNSIIGESMFLETEILIVDDGSTDETETIVKEYSSYKNIIYTKRDSKRKKGANTCRNIGFENASGKYIKWLDSDDILHDNILEKQFFVLENNPNIDVCFCHFGYFQTNDKKIEVIDKLWSRLITSNSTVKDYIYDRLKMPTPSGLWRKANMGIEPFKEGLMNSQEWLMHLKYFLKNTQYESITDVGGYVRVHDNRMSSKGNKLASYYFNQCYSRFLAVKYISQSEYNILQFKWHLFKFFCWNYIFIIYKKGFAQALTAFKWFITILWYLVKPSKIKSIND